MSRVENICPSETYTKKATGTTMILVVTIETSMRDTRDSTMINITTHITPVDLKCLLRTGQQCTHHITVIQSTTTIVLDNPTAMVIIVTKEIICRHKTLTTCMGHLTKDRWWKDLQCTRIMKTQATKVKTALIPLINLILISLKRKMGITKVP